MAIDLSALTNTVSEAAQEQGVTNEQAVTPDNTDALQAEIARLKAEQAQLKAGKTFTSAGSQAGNSATSTPATNGNKALPAAQGLQKPRIPDVPLPDAQIPRFQGGKFTGSYPADCSPQEKMILVAIHACKSKPKADGTAYAVMATFGGALYGFLHTALIPSVFSDKEACNAVLFPLVEGMEKKGLISTQCKGKGQAMMFFDGREHKAAVRSTIPIANDLKAAFKAAFAAA